MKRNKVSIWFYVVMAIVALINCIFQLINGTFYWGNGLVLIIFILVIIYKATRLYRKENLLFWREDPEELDEDDENDVEELNWNPSFQFASLSSDLANRLHK